MSTLRAVAVAAVVVVAGQSWTLPASANPLAAAIQPATAPISGAAPLPAVASPATPAAPVVTLHAKIDLTTQTATILAHGQPLHTWKISSGTAEHATPRGNFQPQWMAKMWFSKKYDDAPMPHAVFFNGGVAMHATQATHRLGQPASHGCVRLAPANAAAFYALVQKHGMKSTRISVFGTPNFAPRVAQRQPDAGNRVRMATTAPMRPVSAYPIYAAPQKQTYFLDSLFGTPAPAPVVRTSAQPVRIR